VTSKFRQAILATACLLPLSAHAAAGPARPAGARPVTIDAPVRATLPNGLRVVIVRDRLAPVVTTEITYLVGSNEAPPGFPGTAHALEHMMFRGADGLDKDQLAAIGARLGGKYNAQTTETATQYFYTAPADDLPVMLRIEALRMGGLSLKEADWTHERGAIEQEVSRDLSSPAYVYLSQLQSLLFANTPYQHDALGTRDSFDRTDTALLRQFYERWYAPNDAILVIAGDIDPARALAAVRSTLGAIPSRTLPPLASVAPGNVSPRTLTLQTDYPVGFATLAWRMPGLTDRDFAAADILGDVLGSKRGALYGLVPAGHALATQFLYRAKSDVGFGVALAAFPKGADPAPVLADLKRVIADAVSQGLPADLVEAAKQKEVAQLAFTKNDIENLAETWSRALALQHLHSPDDIANAYRAVTKADVDRVARLMLDPAHQITAVLTPRAAGHPVAGSGFGGAESFASAPEHPVPLPSWAATALAALHIPAAGPAPITTTLPSGLRLIIHPTAVSDTVSVYGLIRQEPGLEEPKGQEGISEVAEALFDYGSTHLDRLAYRRAVDAIAADLDTGQFFSLKVAANHFDRGMALLADGELHPALPDAAFPIVQRQTAQQLAGLLQSPAYLFGRAQLKATRPDQDPELREATPASIGAITPASLRAFVARAYRPDLTTIVIVGHVDPAHARDLVVRDFGDWRASGPTPAVNLPPIPPSKPSDAYVPDPSALQTQVTLAESLPVAVTSDDRFVLELGNEVLGGGFASRLMRDLRVRNGLVYGVSSRLDWGRTRTDYAVSFGADADKVARAKALAIADIQAMMDHPVSDDELDLAKAALLRRLPLKRASVDAIAMQDLFLADRNLPLDEPDRAAHAYVRVTSADLQAAARKWLRPNDLSQIERGPPRDAVKPGL
jgi:zinc protease